MVYNHRLFKSDNELYHSRVNQSRAFLISSQRGISYEKDRASCNTDCNC